MARPSEYNEEIQRLADEYVNDSTADNMDLPTVEGLAMALGKDDDTIVDWASKPVTVRI